MKVLVVDDSRVMRQLVLRALRQAGHGHHQFLEAESAMQAFGMVEADRPDLVLCDWNMPGSSGLDLLGRLRRTGSHVPFGLVTSEGSEEMRHRAAAAGAAFLVAKPFTPEDLSRALDAVTHGRTVAEEDADELPEGLLPHPLRVKDLLEGLLSREVLLGPGLPVVPTLAQRVAVGAYVDDHLQLAALVAADLRFAAFAGAAIGLVSTRVAAEQVAEEALSDVVADNLAEVLNVCAGLLNAPGLPHVRLYATYGPDDAIPGDIAGLLRALSRRLDLAVDIAGYGGGALSFVRA